MKLARVCYVQAGGFVHDGRVNGTLNLSRALGDMEFKRSTQLPPAEQVYFYFGLFELIHDLPLDYSLHIDSGVYMIVLSDRRRVQAHESKR